ncbi:carboxypeptidase-like regulatory domain-containing protein [uncultured Cetobacterium sp.]|uniref:carboxypeptidase-like regulatory domain-containing protein n=1 Tax=uncultured Cetobacterium sp. TaxID=527638 RepID=UPI0026062D72|nr:carboxypeptidase-like regulatory domain-containing protein [uncultured Cetobacterium sp.]
MRLKFSILFFIFFSLVILGNTNFVNIHGFVTDKEFRLGNATVSFHDSTNKVKSVKTDINGSFNIQLQKNKYRVSVKKNGYTSLLGDNYFVDYIFNKPKPLILSMTNNKISIYGKVFSDNGDFIKDANVKIKIGENLENIKTNSNGIFYFEGEVGLISIFAEKIGYYGNGTSLLIKNEKFINDISIILQEKTFYISGALVDRNNFLKNLEIELINASNNKLISKVTTNSDGLFEFRNIRFYEKAYFKISNINFRSEDFIINRDLRQFNIFVN